MVTTILMSFPKERQGELGANFLEQPNLSGIDTNQPMKVSGGVVVNLSQGEIDSINTANAAAHLTALKQAAKDIFLTPTGAQNQAIALGFQTLRDMMLSEINLLRAAVSPPLSARTITQFNNTFKSTYEAKIDALT